ncbi:glycine--tRNA ligase subunit beta [Parvularcula sp. IMCC14364]|uniref:glycine--tRNA ligase subunit beta n=1 Tax=Parvularcula sp. IMCC14364 TaxID=3067902 RepID=UPI0027426B5C|nr:glycine--tRNA ligase subunit beta [Parvularcula sp. IMCC14364]
MPDLLLEIFSEEIPARMQSRAATDLQKLVQDALFGAGFMPEGAKAFATPRRLSLVVTGLPGAQPDRKEEKKGPRVGAPDKAVAGFLKSAGLYSLNQCEKRADKKGEFYVAVIDEKGKPTASVIAGFLPELIRKFPWQKSMRWGDGDLRWVRPMHSILCTFDSEIVPFEVEGIIAGDRTYGHRFMAPAEIQVRSFEDYEMALSRAKVVLDGERRVEQILEEAKGLCAAQGLELVEDQGLLNEVAGLAEWPVTLMGSFDEKFLKLPDEVLTATMKGHQKYFSVRDPKTGALTNRFIFVSNIEAPDGGKAMRAGYERVLTARLSDAWFLYSQDLKTPLEDHAKKLHEVTFFEGLGMIGDKVDRVAALAREIAPTVGADPGLAEKAARLAKADLVTGMVYEFPELQGLMGRYYAEAQNEPDQISKAIVDHYKPVGQSDEIPSGSVSAALSLADKLDSLVGFFAINEKPTGSKDPFALRRATLGVIRIVLENTLRIRLGERLQPSLQLYKNNLSESFGPGSVSELLPFFHDRLKVYLKDKGHRHDHVDAVRHRPDGTLEDDLVLIVKKLEGLEAFLQAEDGANLIAAYKRAGNILKAEEKKEGASFAPAVDAGLLQEPAEKSLHEAMTRAQATFGPAIEQEDFSTAMTALAALRGPLDAFFEDVTVNADDDKLRRNRLALLSSIKQTCEQVADFSRIEG